MKATTVYITGASAGLGRAIAQQFSDRGAVVGLIARERIGLQNAAMELPALSALATADVSVPEQLEQAVASLEREIGPPDIWINNAMATIFSRFEDISSEEFAQAINITFLGSVHGLQQALKRMRPRGGGHIIQIGSALAYRAIPLQAPYCAAKLAIRGAVDSLRCELLHDKSPISLTMVHMPAMNTPQFDWAARHMEWEPQPVAPVYAAEACAEAVVWAAGHPRMREVWVGKSTLKAILGNKFLPAYMDRYLSTRAYSGQFEKPSEKRDKEGNLFESVAEFHKVKGHFGEKERSKVTWIGTSETREWAFAAAIMVLAVAVVAGLLAL